MRSTKLIKEVCKNMTKKRFKIMSIILTFAVLLACMPMAGLSAFAASVVYGGRRP